MYQRLRPFCGDVSESFWLGRHRLVWHHGWSYDHPKPGMGLVSLLVKALVLRHLVLCVDHSEEELAIAYSKFEVSLMEAVSRNALWPRANW